MIFEDRVEALEPLGFTPRQTRFLVTVALHSGYCLRRQYVAFAGVQYGKNVRDFLDGLVERQLAERFTCRPDRGHVYHLYARAIYRALKQDENRNRREASAALIARKIMVLDYVLAHADVDWCATEQDKVELFVDRFGVPVSDLPQRLFAAAQPGGASTTRYFMHKLPICVAGDPPVVCFVYLATDQTGRGFEQFLLDHVGLLSRLSAWTIVAVAPPHIQGLTACESVFARYLQKPAPSVTNGFDDLRWYFVTRTSVERGEFERLSVGDIDRFRSLREQFRAASFERLYGEWLTHGDDALRPGETRTAAAVARGVGQLVTEVLTFDYSQFGSLPGVA
jgi:hypothetical protein